MMKVTTIALHARNSSKKEGLRKCFKNWKKGRKLSSKEVERKKE